ncbi:FAD-dependent monooxygenase [Pseudonocardia nematodicida]|uniref:FAD-dependent monooxygenase n=1 Tax=Pseudonocardia nematodicida TaxID=1206997 RepID=A0ABV1KEB4_9PSEU
MVADTRDTGVIVVGAGPTGLMLAAELRLGGADVVVLERLAEPTGQSRGLGFTARATELFLQRGLGTRFGTLETSPLGHFGGVQFDYTVLPDAHFGARGIPQSQTEAVLEERARELGADVRRGWSFDGLLTGADPGDTGVRIRASGPDGPRELRAAYLVGADGGRSAVRSAAGFESVSTPATRGMYLADVTGLGLPPRFLGERLHGGMVMAAPLAPGVDRIIVCEDGVPARRRDETVGFDEVAAAWKRITGEDIGHGGADWVSSFTDATHLVTEYARGRVLLAGDAAHTHLPAGGQGLSAGVQDAVNLGWKLAAALRGDAAPGLVATYHDERHPAGQRLLTNSRVQGTVFLGGPEADPLRALFTELIGLDEVKRHLAGTVSGLDVAYEVGPGAHPLLGRRLPPRPLEPPVPPSTFDLLHPARGVLLVAPGPAADGPAAIADGWTDRVDVVVAGVVPAGDGDPVTGTTALLVRPDGHVVWATTTDAPDGTDGLRDALRSWFGAPTPSSDPRAAAARDRTELQEQNT